ncbi:MAG: O-antigen ligase family protein [Bacteroidales bacterium]|nr:O-antigen ligase family protein [Bacteroidales bacterium]
MLRKAGFVALGATLIIISLPRSWALYPLGLFLFIGLVLWISEFRHNMDLLKENILFFLPPVIYFLVHVVSLATRSGPLNLLEDRLMFLLVPIFGLPLFMRLTHNERLVLIKVFITGILLVALILLIRIVIYVNRLVPDDMSFAEYSLLHKYWYFSAHISVFENPTYLSMKIIWVLLLVLILNKQLRIKSLYLILISVFSSVFLFLLSSRAGIAFWIITLIYTVFWMYRRKIIRTAGVALIVPSILIITFLGVMNNPRISVSLNDLFIKLQSGQTDLKNLDQRTREWYNAVQIIREYPLTGAGLSRIKEVTYEGYLRNGFTEEAKYNYNAHNQYLEAQMTFGIAGTIALLWMLLTPLLFARVSYFPLLSKSLFLLMSFFLMFESMFNRQWGIMFFLLFMFIVATPMERSQHD